jgi:hypothetical protein
MTARIDAFQRSFALVSAVLFTTVLVFASTPMIPVA